MFTSVTSLLLVGGLFHAATIGATPLQARDGPVPTLPYDPNSSKYCSWWVDLNTAVSCPSFLSSNFIALEDFRRWNPSITADCGNLVAGKSYCVEVTSEPAPVPSTTLQPSTLAPPSSSTSTPAVTTSAVVPVTTSTPAPTTTKPSNGVVTPQPIQPGMVENCAKFHWIAEGVTCSQVISYQKITLADFVKWNANVGSDCSGMWAETYVCVGLIGGSTTTPPSTTTSAGNGVQTPQPTQPGMVTNCNKFHWVAQGVVCSQITSYNKISLADFVKWNPTVGSDCTGMWAEVNVCVGVIGGTTTAKPTTTTSAGNGIQTPQPTQPGMVTNCNKFHWVAQGVVCSQITSYNKISLADFVKWNPTVGSDCTKMQAGVNVCVGVIGGTTTTTTKPTTTTSAGNGIQTPQPTQPGMVTNCKKFHYAAEGVVCSQIISYQKITLADFVKWNPGVGADCRTMWAGTYTCVGV